MPAIRRFQIFKNVLVYILALGLAGCALPDFRPGNGELPKSFHRAVGGPAVGPEKPAESNRDPRLRPVNEKAPFEITSDRMEYQETGRVTIFTGQVKVNQESAWLYSPYLELRSADNLVVARQGVTLVDRERKIELTARELETQKNLAHVLARGQVVLHTRDEAGLPLRLFCDQLEWNAPNRVRAEGGATVVYRDLTATASSMDFYKDSQTLHLESGGGKCPVVYRGGDTLTGNELECLIREKRYLAVGRAKAALVPPEDASVKSGVRP